MKPDPLAELFRYMADGEFVFHGSSQALKGTRLRPHVSPGTAVDGQVFKDCVVYATTDVSVAARYMLLTAAKGYGTAVVTEKQPGQAAQRRIVIFGPRGKRDAFSTTLGRGGYLHVLRRSGFEVPPVRVERGELVAYKSVPVVATLAFDRTAILRLFRALGVEVVYERGEPGAYSSLSREREGRDAGRRPRVGSDQGSRRLSAQSADQQGVLRKQAAWMP